MQRLITITLLGLAISISSTWTQQLPFIHPPVPGLPANTDTGSTKPPATTPSPTTAKPMYLENYLPVAMQALAYYIELLQYEPTHTTTLEPPFEGIEKDGGTTYTPPKTTPMTGSTTTTSKPWWAQTTTATTGTYTTTKKPTTIWWQSPSTTQKPSTVWWVPPSTTKKPSTVWWVPPSTTTKVPTTKIPTTAWWETTTVRKPPQETTVPWWQTTITRKPTTERPTAFPTTYHRPGIFAPMPPIYTKPTWNKPVINNAIESTTERSQDESTPGYPYRETTTSFPSIMNDKNFFDWFFQPKSLRIQPEIEYNFQLLDPLPAALIRDIQFERYELPALLDKDNINEFLRIYDDSFGRYRPITGKKRVPPTKPYVDFLFLYDLLKREAKAQNLNMYLGYTDSMVKDLHELSKRSAERQLHTILTRMLLRKEVSRADVLTRVNSIIKELGTPILRLHGAYVIRGGSCCRTAIPMAPSVLQLLQEATGAALSISPENNSGQGLRSRKSAYSDIDVDEILPTSPICTLTTADATAAQPPKNNIGFMK